MKKMFSGLMVAGAAMILSGCGSQTATPQSGTQNQQSQAPASQSQEKNSIIGSIQQAMGLGSEMKCSYKTKIGSDTIESTAYTKGGKFKSSGIVGGKTMNTLYDGSVMYTWEEGKTTGNKMTMSCINDLKTSIAQNNPTFTDKVKSFEDEMKDATDTTCSASLDSVDFSAPSNVTFADQCEMLKKATEMMKNVKLPAGVPGGIPQNMPNLPK